MSATYYEANQILDRAFGNQAPTTPGTLYFGLADATLSAGGAFTDEVPNAGAYARVAVTNNKTNWGNAASGALSNLTSISFPESTASWGTVVAVFVADSGTYGAGNMLYFASLATSRAVPTGTTLFFDVGAVDVSLT